MRAEIAGLLPFKEGGDRPVISELSEVISITSRYEPLVQNFAAWFCSPLRMAINREAAHV
jgi:hypothetical protein